MTEFKISNEAKRILLDGELLEKTETLGLKLSHNYDFARRMIQEISLIMAGQATKKLDIGINTRTFSHAGFYGSHGFGRDFTWDIATKSGIFPMHDPIRTTRLDNITEAALIGTISESQIVPPITVTHDLVFVGEYSTLMRGTNADGIAADMRSLLETGEYSRRLAKVAGLKYILNEDKDNKQKRKLEEAILDAASKGMAVDPDIGGITVHTTTSWIISSARFGSNYAYGRPLLDLGDVDRYRWRTHLPTRDERLKITSEVGSLPPTIINENDIKHVCKAWNFLLNTMQKITSEKPISISSDSNSYHMRKKIWDDTQNQIIEKYPDIKPIHEEQLLNLRARSEFRRIMIQHATLKQFQRDQGYDLAEPGKFIIDYDEDGEFAKQLWLNEYVPSMIDVVEDIIRYDPKRTTKRKKTLTQLGKEIVMERLENGTAETSELVELVKAKKISESLLNNQILPQMRKDGTICKPTGYRLYKLKKNCNSCSYFADCLENDEAVDL